MNENFVDDLEGYIKSEKLGRIDGTEGVKNLCAIVETLGYEDPMHFGQHEKGCYGSLIDFLGDNPGAMDLILDFIKDNGPNIDEWSENLPALPKEFVLDDEGLFMCGEVDIRLANWNEGSIEWIALDVIQLEYAEVTQEIMEEAAEWFEEQKTEKPSASVG